MKEILMTSFSIDTKPADLYNAIYHYVPSQGVSTVLPEHIKSIYDPEHEADIEIRTHIKKLIPLSFFLGKLLIKATVVSALWEIIYPSCRSQTANGLIFLGYCALGGLYYTKIKPDLDKQYDLTTETAKKITELILPTIEKIEQHIIIKTKKTIDSKNPNTILSLKDELNLFKRKLIFIGDAYENYFSETPNRGLTLLGYDALGKKINNRTLSHLKEEIDQSLQQLAEELS